MAFVAPWMRVREVRECRGSGHSILEVRSVCYKSWTGIGQVHKNLRSPSVEPLVISTTDTVKNVTNKFEECQGKMPCVKVRNASGKVRYVMAKIATVWRRLRSVIRLLKERCYFY